MGYNSHMLVSLEIMWGHSRHFIECCSQELFDLVTHVDLLLKQIQVIHPRVF